MRIGIGIGDIAGRAGDMDELVLQAQRAEEAGFSSVWLANIFGIDALTAAVVVGRATSKVMVGTGVVPTYPRHPFAMAQQAVSVNAAIGKRLLLGIARSYSHMKEYVAALAPLVREGKVSFQGELYKVNAQLRVPGSAPFPILLAALAPKMLALAGSVADGTIT